MSLPGEEPHKSAQRNLPPEGLGGLWLLGFPVCVTRARGTSGESSHRSPCHLVATPRCYISECDSFAL